MSDLPPVPQRGLLFPQVPVVVKGAGDLGTGVAWRLHKAGFPVIITELERPLVVRRTVAFASAVYEEAITVQGVTARLAGGFQQAREYLDSGWIPVLIDPDTRALQYFAPTVLIDAVMAKRNTGTRITDAPLVIGLGPGFAPGWDCHAVIETKRGHDLGRVWWDRSAEADTGTPGKIAGKGAERVLRAPCDGVVAGVRQIGDQVAAGEIVARVGEEPVLAPFDGRLRGLVRDGLAAQAGMKIGDIDARSSRDACYTISDKSLAIGGGALEAVLSWLAQKDHSA